MKKSIEKINKLIKEGIIILENVAKLSGSSSKENNNQIGQRISEMSEKEVDIRISDIINKPNDKIDKMTQEDIDTALKEKLEEENNTDNNATDKKDRPNFLNRNKDQIVLGIFLIFLGIVLTKLFL